ncbi:MAG: hypothetical protein U1A78_15965 [Polyangia bacterium]
MGEHFKRQKTKQFNELAMANYKQLKIPRLPLLGIKTFQTIYQCLVSGAGSSVLSQLTEETSLVLMRQGGTSWMVIFGNQEVGLLSEQSASDLSEKAERHGLPNMLNASFGSISELSGSFEISCELPDAEPAQESTSKKASRGRS